jgi:hypothetical protein
VERYFPPEYAPVAAPYGDFRCLLLHNFSAGQSLGFTHNEPKRHLQVQPDGRLVLDRGSLVAAVAGGFDAFEEEVEGSNPSPLRHTSRFPLNQAGFPDRPQPSHLAAD